MILSVLTNVVCGLSSNDTSLINVVFGANSKDISLELGTSPTIILITCSHPLQLLSQVKNVPFGAETINCAGSWWSAESLDKWAGRRNIVSYVEHKLSAGLDLLLVEEHKCYQCNGSGATRLGIICLIIVPSLRCCITPKHSLVYLFPKQYRQTKQEFLEIESLPYLVEKCYLKTKHI